ncbi:MAG TPA: response regulator, partial [Bacteroidales bacterium]|nr:response regulator [Bacteroidales bacterium]
TFTASFKNIKITTIQPDRKRRFEWTEKEIRFEPATVLVIDDVDYNRELAKTFLLQLNLHVLEARCANDGITIASVHQPDLILLDLRMPKMDGFEAVKLLKSNPKTKKIPCIAFTASTMKQEEKNILEMFDDYLLKPLTRNEMVDCLMKFLPHQIPDKQLKLKSNAETESALDPEKFAITPDKLVQLQKDCSNEIMPLLKNLKLYMDTDVSEKMILKLEKISENYQVPHCDFLAKQLKNSVENYDFTQFINVLNQLEQIITIITNK